MGAVSNTEPAYYIYTKTTIFRSLASSRSVCTRNWNMRLCHSFSLALSLFWVLCRASTVRGLGEKRFEWSATVFYTVCTLSIECLGFLCSLHLFSLSSLLRTHTHIRAHMNNRFSSSRVACVHLYVCARASLAFVLFWGFLWFSICIHHCMSEILCVRITQIIRLLGICFECICAYLTNRLTMPPIPLQRKLYHAYYGHS